MTGFTALLDPVLQLLGVNSPLLQIAAHAWIAKQALDQATEACPFSAGRSGKRVVATWEGGAGQSLLARKCGAPQGEPGGHNAEPVDAWDDRGGRGLKHARLDFGQRESGTGSIRQRELRPDGGSMVHRLTVFSEDGTQGYRGPWLQAVLVKARRHAHVGPRLDRDAVANSLAGPALDRGREVVRLFAVSLEELFVHLKQRFPRTGLGAASQGHGQSEAVVDEVGADVVPGADSRRHGGVDNVPGWRLDGETNGWDVGEQHGGAIDIRVVENERNGNDRPRRDGPCRIEDDAGVGHTGKNLQKVLASEEEAIGVGRERIGEQEK